MPGPFSAVLSRRVSLAPGLAELSFQMRTPARLEFKAGQFVSIAVPPASASATPEPAARRSYSIASQSDAGDVLRFIIRVIPDGAASTYLMSLPIGAAVDMTGPHGFFVLDAVHPGDVVFGATGTGIAAVMPMLGELTRRDRAGAPRGRRLVLWGLRRESDICARAELETLVGAAAAELDIRLSAPDQSWSGGQGRIMAPLLDRLPTLASPIFYLVGNGAMIADVKAALVARGVNRKAQIRTEAFFD